MFLTFVRSEYLSSHVEKIAAVIEDFAVYTQFR